MEYIEINKKRMPFSFNMAAFLEIEKSTGLTVSQVFSEEGMEPSNFLKLLYLGLKYGADEVRQKFDMTYSQFVDMMGQNNDIMKQLGELLAEDIRLINTLYEEKAKLVQQPQTEDDSKKNLMESGLTTSG